MKNFLTLLLAAFVFVSCTNTEVKKETKMDENKQTPANPFFAEFNTPHRVPPFDLIKEEHFMPAFEQGMKEQKAIIDEIVASKEEPTFENVIVKLEKSGQLLGKVARVFYNLNSANTNEKIQEISRTLAPIMSKHGDDISLNQGLFEKVKAVYNKKDELKLDYEQEMLLTRTYKDFAKGGANLNEADKDKLRTINSELASATVKFGENVLKETNAFQMFLDKKEDLAGLPETVIQGAAEAAKAAGQEGKWLFTIHKPSLLPFLQYSEKRDLREKMYKGYINVGDNDNENDNKELVKKITNLRLDKAQLLGYANYSDYALEETMAKNSGNVYKLLDELMKPTIKMAKNEATDMQKLIDKEGGKFKLAPWDWWYYAEKIKKEKYDLDEEMLRPYFKLENVLNGAFMVSNKLYGITAEERPDIKGYHPDVKAYEIKEADGKHIGIFFADFHPRASKRGGAWASSYRSQQILNGEFITPVIVNVCNFSKPTADKPALLSLDEVTTLFHEFGHALHSLFSNHKYNSLGVSRDFVELPSQIMENWATEGEVLKMYAKHYKTGEAMPDELIEKMKNSSHFNQGFTTMEYLAAAYLDLNFYTLKEKQDIDVREFEKTAMTKVGLIPEIVARYRPTYFRHIFAGGYSSQYYSYIWSGVLDADAFEAFKETGDIFNQEKAKLFREEVLSQGGSREAMEMYKKFRGAEPKKEPLLKRRGLI